jgi:hypothetical protein
VSLVIVEDKKIIVLPLQDFLQIGFYEAYSMKKGIITGYPSRLDPTPAFGKRNKKTRGAPRNIKVARYVDYGIVYTGLINNKIIVPHLLDYLLNSRSYFSCKRFARLAL